MHFLCSLAVCLLSEVDPWLATPPTVRAGIQPDALFGDPPPDLVDLDDLCPPVSCPDCPEMGVLRPTSPCQEGGFSYLNIIGKLEVKPLAGETFPGLPNRTLSCELYAVGKPVFSKDSGEKNYGSWMRDPVPRNDMTADMYWATKLSDSFALYEYSNKSTFRNSKPSHKYALPYAICGTSPVVYNGSFFYHMKGEPRIIKFDMSTSSYEDLTVPLAVYSGDSYLYNNHFNYLDLSVDDNGLWVIYALPDINNTVVMKVDTSTLKIQYIWNISINNNEFGEMFVACGVLYGVNSATARNTNIRFALDLYRSHLLKANLAFTNPFRNTTMITYNHRTKELFTWDKGNHLTYPVRYNAMDINSTNEGKGEPEANAQIQTGVEVTT